MSLGEKPLVSRREKRLLRVQDISGQRIESPILQLTHFPEQDNEDDAKAWM